MAKKDGLEKEHKELSETWGANHHANMLLARHGAAAVGASAKAVHALEKDLGYVRVMEIFRAIGAKSGKQPEKVSKAKKRYGGK